MGRDLTLDWYFKCIWPDFVFVCCPNHGVGMNHKAALIWGSDWAEWAVWYCLWLTMRLSEWRIMMNRTLNLTKTRTVRRDICSNQIKELVETWSWKVVVIAGSGTQDESACHTFAYQHPHVWAESLMKLEYAKKIVWHYVKGTWSNPLLWHPYVLCSHIHNRN